MGAQRLLPRIGRAWSEPPSRSQAQDWMGRISQEGQGMAGSRIYWTFSSLALILLGTIGCGGEGAPPANINVGGNDAQPNAANANNQPANPAATVPEGVFPTPILPPPPNLHPQVRIKTNLGDIVVKLDRENAPISVENFLRNYVESGYYTDTLVHYVQKGTMLIAGGVGADRQRKLTKAPIFNEALRTSPNRRGTLAMSRDPGDVHSATSQFFFNLADNAALDHKGVEAPEDYGYTVFGEVVEGLDVLDKIGAVEVQQSEGFPNTPVSPVIIQSIEPITK